MDIEYPMTDEEFQKYKKEKETEKQEKEQMRLNRKEVNNPQIRPVQYFNRGFPEPLNHHVSYNRGMNHFVPQPPQTTNLFNQQQQQQQPLFSNQTYQPNPFSNTNNIFQNQSSQPPSNIFGRIKKVPAQSNANIFANNNSQVFYSRSPFYWWYYNLLFLLTFRIDINHDLRT